MSNTINFSVYCDYSIDVSPNETVAELKNRIRGMIPYDDFDLYANIIGQDVGRYMRPENRISQYFNIERLVNYDTHIIVRRR